MACTEIELELRIQLSYLPNVVIRYFLPIQESAINLEHSTNRAENLNTAGLSAQSRRQILPTNPRISNQHSALNIIENISDRPDHSEGIDISLGSHASMKVCEC